MQFLRYPITRYADELSDVFISGDGADLEQIVAARVAREGQVELGGAVHRLRTCGGASSVWRRRFNSRTLRVGLAGGRKSPNAYQQAVLALEGAGLGVGMMPGSDWSALNSGSERGRMKSTADADGRRGVEARHAQCRGCRYASSLPPAFAASPLSVGKAEDAASRSETVTGAPQKLALVSPAITEPRQRRVQVVCGDR